MKKIYIAFMTVAALAAISCNTKEEYGSLPSGEVMFTAVQADNPESRTILQSDGSVFWSADDSINLFYGTAGSAKLISNNSEPAQQTTFSGSLGGYNHNGSDYFHAVYPYSAENTFDGTAFTITLPEVQSSVAGSFADDLFISMARSQDYTLQFYNLCGGVKFSVAEAGIKYVTFRGNNNEPLAGKVNVIFNDDGKPVVQTVVDGKTELRLDAPNGGTFEPGEWYYIVSLPATLSAGYTMTFYKDEKYAERITDSSITIKRAVWGRLTNADSTGSESTTGTDNGYEWVDLGLPSGLKWATCNVGADAPEEYGDYFAWGETEPYYSSQDPLTWKSGKSDGYDWASYKWCNGTYKTQTKYCTDSSYGTVDNKTVLDPEDDAAAVNWGGTWRMPTDDEWSELLYNCTWTWTTQNGVNGRLVTGPNGNSIFLPAAGGRYSTSLGDAGSYGLFWSSSLYTDYPYLAYLVLFGSDYVTWYENSRCDGRSVRPVTDEGVRVSVTNVSLDNDSLNLTIDETATLTATVTPSNATQPAVIWSSSDASVASVDYTGKVTAIASGTATITAKAYDGGYTAMCTVTVKQDASESEEDPFDVGSDLSVNGTANCYVVPKAGEFSFDASVMGNGPDGYIWEQTQGTDMHLWPYHREEVYFSTNDVLPTQAFVIWDDNGVITDVKYNTETKRISFTTTGNKGNALIGLFDKNATESGAQKSQNDAYWSWHIWCTDSPKRFIQYDDKEDDYEILDRNLGATSADPADGEATYGYFYQFGRKDPIKGYDGIAGDQKKARQELKYSVNHPTYLYKLNTKTKEWFNDGKSSLATVCADLWGNPAWQFCSTANIHPYQALRSELRKTIYDPCPPGYMVPPETAWTGIDAESIVILDNGVLIPTASGDSFYPFAGYISDLNSWENDSMGYYAYNGCTITMRERRVSRVYSSYTGLDSEFKYNFDFAPDHFGGCSLSVHVNEGDPITPEYLIFEPMYQTNRQRGHNVRCVREFNK